MREFNTTGPCMPDKHYMVDTTTRVAQVRHMVDKGDFFCINRARQYGKTTLLAALDRELSNDYEVASLDFQEFSHQDFSSEGSFAIAFAETLLEAADHDGLRLTKATEEALGELVDSGFGRTGLRRLFSVLRIWLRESSRPVVLIVDEVDSATNNQVFLDFLAQLRNQYQRRERNPSYPAFRSVILVGVTDVKHLKTRIRPDDESKVNSPWNIAADFKVRMSFEASEVANMLADYEADHHTGMDIASVAEEIIAWTSGYPFLVSRLCQLVGENSLGWSRAGVGKAAKMLLGESNTLFESLAGKLDAYPGLKTALREVLMDGRSVTFNPSQEEIAQLTMFGFTKEVDGRLAIANRIFETFLYNLFLSDEELAGSRVYNAGEFARNRFVKDGRLDMCAVLEGFRKAYTLVYGPPEEGERFSEFDGRRQFLLYLKPIINGTGNFYVEAQTRDQTRTDVVVDYAGEQFVIELKIWYGQSRHEDGERQLSGYLQHFCLDVGYLLSFSFNKHKQPGLRRVELDDKTIWEETV